MNIPRFSNPHLLVQAAEPVSRANLYDHSDDALLGPDFSQVSELNVLVKKRLGELFLESSRKRRRIDGPVENPQTLAHAETRNTAFRLLSATRPPRIMHLEPKAPQEIKVREPPFEDDEVEARIRKERAAVAAVDFVWILSQSRTPYRARKDKISTVVATVHASPNLPLALLERLRSPTPYSRPLIQSSSPKPSPHENRIKEECCPRVVFEWANTANTSAAPKKRKKRRVSYAPSLPSGKPYRGNKT
ncbi:hypothetical protein OF83DRAFT_823503 [Amylostereum chailletii]|nr:hypothetical protein OF83DRAFT_823503 [Amylostereum chailletii]